MVGIFTNQILAQPCENSFKKLAPKTSPIRGWRLPQLEEATAAHRASSQSCDLTSSIISVRRSCTRKRRRQEIVKAHLTAARNEAIELRQQYTRDCAAHAEVCNEIRRLRVQIEDELDDAVGSNLCRAVAECEVEELARKTAEGLAAVSNTKRIYGNNDWKRKSDFADRLRRELWREEALLEVLEGVRIEHF